MLCRPLDHLSSAIYAPVQEGGREQQQEREEEEEVSTSRENNNRFVLLAATSRTSTITTTTTTKSVLSKELAESGPDFQALCSQVQTPGPELASLPETREPCRVCCVSGEKKKEQQQQRPLTAKKKVSEFKSQKIKSGRTFRRTSPVYASHKRKK